MKAITRKVYTPLILTAILICMISLSACSGKQTPEEMFQSEIQPYIDTLPLDAGTESLLPDLTLKVQIDELDSETAAHGEILFISDEIENYSPEKQYALTQAVAKQVFLYLTDGEENLFYIRFGDFRLTLSHGTGYSEWQTTDGTEYISSYYSLSKNGEIIYDNPENDLESELEAFFGVPYDEWLEKQSTETVRSVPESDEDYWNAIAAAQKLVREELKSPSTAQFPAGAEAYSVSRDEEYWIVSGYVDAQNSFAAAIRENWTASFKMKEQSNSQYSLTDYTVTFG